MITVKADAYPPTRAGDPGYRDWVMFCTEHQEYVTCAQWQDAYEAALGHACMQHPSTEICERRGHDYRLAGDQIQRWGRSSWRFTCARCGEPGYSIEEAG